MKTDEYDESVLDMVSLLRSRDLSLAEFRAMQMKLADTLMRLLAERAKERP